MILILNDVHAADDKKVLKLRELLNHDRLEYFKYARACQRLYNIVSVVVRGKVIDTMYFKKENVSDYIKNLDEDIRIVLFYFIRAINLFMF